MEFGRIDEQVQMLQTLGYTLNIEEKLRLKLAYANILSANEHIDQLKFWGRIQGLTKSYYVIVGLTFRKSYEFAHKTFFYALSTDLQFKELPDLLLQHQGLADKYNAMPFVGDPAKILINVEGEGEQQQEKQNEEGNAETKPEKGEDQDEEVKKIPKKNFTELSRLSYVIRAIESDVQCVPKGSYKMTPQHQIRQNTHFYGLDTASCRNPASWQHFRSPVTVQARQAINDDMVVFTSQFLDSIELDNPSGSWSIQTDSKQKTVSLRSLKWPGYFAFHKLNSDLFGSAYIGDGSKNVDLAFMV